jgi:hypothetical protein
MAQPKSAPSPPDSSTVRQLFRTVLVAGGLLIGAAGCHTMRFELVAEPAANVVTERKSYFFWGLAPTVDVDVLDKCPAGAAAIRERTTFLDGLVGVPTFGIWDMRSTTYYCRAPHHASVQ